MAKNKLLFSTPEGGYVIRPGQSRIITRERLLEELAAERVAAERILAEEGVQDVIEDVVETQGRSYPRGAIDVREYESIRVYAFNRTTSVTSVAVSLLASNNDESRPVGRLERVTLAPGQAYTNSYVVPGRYLDIRLVAARGAAGTDRVDVTVYGHK
ncbi:hypothetical protein [Paenibacillus soyae]|uniref:Uncharacterized protein n=1 Tax=Paenibacillus soyae TaxID=2969249 RepID=A0A9X2MQT0_9BACL|nr:hypothetical protein [Paenibacillus soyae]MCR2804557.1 hypothetical protein [Paenibacillus soyae]